jgi:hypothetical protein
MRSWCGGDVPLIYHYSDTWSGRMDNYSVAERAILRWLGDGKIITIDKHDHRQRELWLMLKGLMVDNLVEVVGQNRQRIIYRLAAASVYEREVGEE